MSSTGRRRNARGEGGQLRDEITAAARELLLEDGGEQAVTLRAIARRIGIAPNSIYAHFNGPEEILRVVATETFQDYTRYLEAAVGDASTPRVRIIRRCRAYLRYGAEHPELYGLIFLRTLPSADVPSPDAGEHASRSIDETSAAIRQVRERTGADSFAHLLADVQAAAADGSSRATDPVVTVTALWAALHGLVLLRATAVTFPWPEAEAFELELISRNALLTPRS